MRLIDADRLKKVLEKNFGHTSGASVLAQLIDAQDTIHPEPHWIPCSERLPEKSGVYTVTDHKGDVVRFVFNTGSDSSRRYWCRCAKAWMTLPEPWKEE